MLYQIYSITIKELKILFRDAAALEMLFIMPVMFILVMSVALNGVFDSGSKNHPIVLLVVNADQGKVAGRVIASLKSVDGLQVLEFQDGAPLTRETADQLIVSGKYHIELIFPSDFSKKIEAAGNGSTSKFATVTFVIDPSAGNAVIGPVRGTVKGYIEREASLTQTPLRINSGFDDAVKNMPYAPALEKSIHNFTNDLSGDNTLESSNLGVKYEEVPPKGLTVTTLPDSAQQNVPAYTIFGVFFIMQPLALSIYEEKTAGTFRRLQAAPLSRAALLLGKLVPFFIINLLQMAFMFTIGVLVFHINLGSDPLALLLVALATAAAANGLGLMVTALAKTREQMTGLTSLLSVTMAALGGMMVPTFVMPQALQIVSRITPHAWALQGFQDVIVRGMGMAAVLPSAGVLLGFAAAFFSVALWRFRFD